MEKEKKSNKSNKKSDFEAWKSIEKVVSKSEEFKEWWSGKSQISVITVLSWTLKKQQTKQQRTRKRRVNFYVNSLQTDWSKIPARTDTWRNNLNSNNNNFNATSTGTDFYPHAVISIFLQTHQNGPQTEPPPPPLVQLYFSSTAQCSRRSSSIVQCSRSKNTTTNRVQGFG